MKKLLLAVGVIAAAFMTTAWGADCVTIKSAKQRLACFDKERKDAAQGSPVADTMPPQGYLDPHKQGEVFRSGDWSVTRKMDEMVDKERCYVVNKYGGVNVDGGKFHLFFKPKVWLEGYIYRIDDAPAIEWRSTTQDERETGEISLSDRYYEIVDGTRLRAKVLTKFDGTIALDIKLTGLKESLGFLKANCPRN